jgi:aminocarboxymuconate-semialdehyde decarboxylase
MTQLDPGEYRRVTRPTGEPGHGVVDFHSHFTPAELMPRGGGVEYRDGVPVYTHNDRLPDVVRRLELMDAAGIDVAFLSSAAGFDAPLERCCLVNDALAELESGAGGRLLGLAHSPPLGGAGALAELERACGELGFRGVATVTINGGRPLDDPALEPFLATVESLGAFLFLHAPLANPSLSLDAFDRYDLFRTVGREFELQLAVLRLVLGGVLDRHPRLVVVVAHLGGGISALWPRVRGYQDKGFWGTTEHARHGGGAEHDVDSYLDRLYFDTSGVFGAASAIGVALAHIPPERLVLGTDYPQQFREPEPVTDFIHELERLEHGEPILRANGKRLLGALERGPAAGAA